MRREIIFLSFLMYTTIITARTTERDSSKFSIGFETGLNHLSSYSLGERKDYVNYGIVIQYFPNEKWSLLTKIRRYDIGLSYSHHPWHWSTEEPHDPNVTYKVGESNIPDGDDYFIYKGKVISMPISILYYVNTKRKLKPFFNLGIAVNYEIEFDMKYNNITLDQIKQLKRFYACFYTGSGIEYTLNPKMFCGLHWDYTFGGYKGNDGGFFFAERYVSNTFLNVSIKHKL